MTSAVQVARHQYGIRRKKRKQEEEERLTKVQEMKDLQKRLQKKESGCHTRSRIQFSK